MAKAAAERAATVPAPGKGARSQNTPRKTANAQPLAVLHSATVAALDKPREKSRSKKKSKDNAEKNVAKPPTDYRLNQSRLPVELDSVNSMEHHSRLAATPGMLLHSVGAVAGVTALCAGFATSKIVGKVTGGSIADSSPFHAGGEAFLTANGIYPTILYEEGRGLVEHPRGSEESYEKLRSAPMFVANHVSYLDALVLPLTLGFPRFMAKSEIRNWPIFGTVGKELDAVWVDRTNADSRTKALEAIDKHCDQWTIGKRALLIFPEGTTSNGKDILEFRKGAFVAGLPVRPVIVKYTGSWDPSNCNFKEKVVQKKSKKKETVTEKTKLVPYTDGDWAMQFLGHWNHACTVVVCEVREPSSDEKADPMLYATNVREEMRHRLEALHILYQENLKVGTDEIKERWPQLRAPKRRVMTFQPRDRDDKLAEVATVGPDSPISDQGNANATDSLERARLRTRLASRQQNKEKRQASAAPATPSDIVKEMDTAIVNDAASAKASSGDVQSVVVDRFEPTMASAEKTS